MSSASRKVIFAALAGNGLIAITKFIAAAMTGSSAMLSEAIHSVVDTGNQLLLLYGLKRSTIPPSEQFPFGHGKEVYFWSFVVAILIFAVGAGVSIYEGIHSILQPTEIKNVMVNYVVIGIAIIFEGAAWYFAIREFSRGKGKWGYIEAVQRGKDPTMFVVLFEDSAALLGLSIALLGIWLTQATGILYFDGIASVLIGIILGGTATWLAYETKSLLIGESAEPEVVESIKKLVSLYPDINHINEILTMHMGPDYILVNISIDFIDTTPAGSIEHIIAEMDKTIKLEHPRVKRIFVEAESRQTGSDPIPTDDSK